jgi:hypothetical protein
MPIFPMQEITFSKWTIWGSPFGVWRIPTNRLSSLPYRQNEPPQMLSKTGQAKRDFPWMDEDSDTSLNKSLITGQGPGPQPVLTSGFRLALEDSGIPLISSVLIISA